MYVEETKKKVGGKQYSCFLLRESRRVNGKVQKRTIANISHLPTQEIEALRQALRYKQAGVQPEEIQTRAGKTVGTLLVVVKLLEKLGIRKALGESRAAQLCSWLIFSRLVEQGSRLSSVRLQERHDVSLLGLDQFCEDELYDALLWLAENQESIQQSLFSQRYVNQAPRLFLYDLTSSYFEGTENELAAWGYNRDGKKGKMQIVFGLLTDKDGNPIAVEVFKGNTADSKTFLALIKGFGERFSVRDIVFVGDRGMIKSTGIDALHEENFKYITAITKPQIETLLKDGVIQLSLFDSELHEVTDESIRYLLRRNPQRAAEIAGTRKNKLEKVKKEADKENGYLAAHPKATAEAATRRVRAMAKRLKIDKLVEIKVEDGKLSVQEQPEEWEKAAQLDGCYVIKTDVPLEELDAEAVHGRYKDLAKIERGFRTIKTGLIEIRPVWLRNELRTKGHVFICMLAYMIARELEKTKIGNETIRDVIEELNRVALLEVEVGGMKRLSIPQPPLRAANILAKLGIRLTSPAKVPTKHKNTKTA